MDRIAAISAVTLAIAVSVCVTAAAGEESQVTSSVVCGTCHRDIYAMWRSSSHASAVENVVFLDALHEIQASDPATGRLCLGCHAPLAETIRDPSLTQQATWEGVSCDTCHSIVSVELGRGGAKQVIDLGAVKRGPIKDAVSPAHEVVYSPLHTSALVCAGCHEFQNAEGTPIITTYSEWQQSAAGREGRSCQACHMRLTRADVVDPKVKRVTRSEVNLHEIPGGHSPTQLNKALSVSQAVSRRGDELTIEIVLANKGAAHAVPTGMPGRSVILALAVRTSDGRSFEERRTYGKTFRDSAGQLITREGRVFAPGVQLESDSRIRPDEQRTETFHFPVAAAATANASLKLRYEHDPGGAPENRTSLTFFTQNQVCPPESH
jgi:hypothetical protein